MANDIPGDIVECIALLARDHADCDGAKGRIAKRVIRWLADAAPEDFAHAVAAMARPTWLASK